MSGVDGCRSSDRGSLQRGVKNGQRYLAWVAMDREWSCHAGSRVCPLGFEMGDFDHFSSESREEYVMSETSGGLGNQ